MVNQSGNFHDDTIKAIKAKEKPFIHKTIDTNSQVLEARSVYR